jgi:hypothetical protein
MLEILELITGRQQHKVGKDGGDFFRKPRPDKGCSATDDDDDILTSSGMKFRNKKTFRHGIPAFSAQFRTLVITIHTFINIP